MASDLSLIEALEHERYQAEDYRRSLETISRVHGSALVVSVDYNLEERQRQLFLQPPFSKNYYLKLALCGEQSLEESVRRLGERFRGYRALLPHRVDRRHNKEVEKIAELVSGAGLYRTRGLFHPNNPLNVCLYGMGFMVGVVEGGTAFFNGDPQPDFPARIAVMAGFSLMCGGIIWLGQTQELSMPRQARYLDKKMKDLNLVPS